MFHLNVHLLCQILMKWKWYIRYISYFYLKRIFCKKLLTTLLASLKQLIKCRKCTLKAFDGSTIQLNLG